MRTGGGGGSVLLGKVGTLTLFFQSTHYFYEGYFRRVPPACAYGGGGGSVRLGKARTLTLFFESTHYFYEWYFRRVPLACVPLG